MVTPELTLHGRGGSQVLGPFGFFIVPALGSGEVELSAQHTPLPPACFCRCPALPSDPRVLSIINARSWCKVHWRLPPGVRSGTQPAPSRDCGGGGWRVGCMRGDSTLLRALNMNSQCAERQMCPKECTFHHRHQPSGADTPSHIYACSWGT